MINTYRARSHTIEAVRYNGSNAAELGAWGVRVRAINRHCSIIFGVLKDDDWQDERVANPGDYVIRDEYGEYYPLPPAIFHATYEMAWPG